MAYQFGITNKNGITHISSVPPSREAVSEALGKTYAQFETIGGSKVKVNRYRIASL